MDSDHEVCPVVPGVYHDFLDVLNKWGAATLPPHRPYECPIELLLRAESPFGWIFPLSGRELETLKEFLDDKLRKGFIQPSTPPAGTGIYFV